MEFPSLKISYTFVFLNDIDGKDESFQLLPAALRLPTCVILKIRDFQDDTGV